MEGEMGLLENQDDIRVLVDSLNFKEKVERSLSLIEEAYKKYGEGLVVANSLGKDSVAVWDLAIKVDHKIRGFIVTTRFKPKETKQFMKEMVLRYPELKIYENTEAIPDQFYFSITQYFEF